MTSDIMRQELYDYLKQLVYPTLRPDDVRYFRFENSSNQREHGREISKDEDDNRFPNFGKIRNYVCASSRTEQFFERFNHSIDELAKYLHESYSQKYRVDLSAYRSMVAGYDAKLTKATNLLSIKASIGEIDLPEVKLLYTEKPREDTAAEVDDLIKCLSKLAAKISAFIHQYNVYGVKFNGTVDGFSAKKGVRLASPSSQLAEALEKTQAVVGKKCSLDILSDGSDELNEMLDQLWRSIHILLDVPLFQECFTYEFTDGRTVTNEEFFETIAAECSSRCPEIVRLLEEQTFLDELHEEKLSSIYKELPHRTLISC